MVIRIGFFLGEYVILIFFGKFECLILLVNYALNIYFKFKNFIIFVKIFLFYEFNERKEFINILYIFIYLSGNSVITLNFVYISDF